MQGEAHQVDRNVDFEFAAALGDFSVGQRADIEELVHGGGDALGHLVLLRPKEKAKSSKRVRSLRSNNSTIRLQMA